MIEGDIFSTMTEARRLETLNSYCLLDTPPDPLCDLVTGLAINLFAADIALISLVDKERQWFKSAKGLAARQTPRSDSFCAHAIVQDKTMVVLDACADERFRHNALVTGEPGIRFYAGAPLITSEGARLGTLCVIGKTTRDAFTADQASKLEQLASIVMARLELLRSSDYLDKLTALPNRSRLIEDLRCSPAMAHRHDNPVTTVAVDVCDRTYLFDMVKALGWDYAEGFLVAAMQRLRDCAPPVVLYRIGTTTFAYVAHGEAAQIQAQVDHISHCFNDAVDHQGIPHRLEIAIGIVATSQCSDTEDLVRALMTATDLARENGTTQRVFEKSQGERQKYSFELLSALPGALAAEGELSLHYQPKISLLTGRCTGVEALIRWRHPIHGDVSPALFIPLTEKTALIRHVTCWALREGIRQAAAWVQRGRPVRVAINVSARDFENDDLINHLRTLLAQHRIPAGLIEIEFTESAISKDPQNLREKILEIKKLGVEVAIDDFGSGFSNLSYLKQIPADYMKIDQSFIRNLETDHADQMIVPSIINLGQKLGFTIIAEGIETERTCKLLKHLGCDQGQGYAIARPMTAQDFDTWLDRNG
ncbi:sensor domain-containing phosphodiesterase [Herbaspirillum sp. alder98]|uniref:sensor domain-containing phosphodiesterase n=1 Tax=Herbaspirillum sp. alder98 TaxID=2913096 RepID=UPI001CD90218|nr:sensor domain-containing phosphodiesterase [Herbaspirillum sp. alder98]MCA1326111.1 sensor domain-containing phosphodiesterase [Herbaspirillum sp. alder98]